MTQREAVLAQAIPDRNVWRDFTVTGLMMLAYIGLLIFMVTRPIAPAKDIPPVLENRSYIWVETETIGGEPYHAPTEECAANRICL